MPNIQRTIRLLLVAWISSLLLPSGLAGDAFTVSDIVKRYDSIEAQTVVAEEWKRHTNDNGSVAWNTSYVLNSYVDMFEATSNLKYLDKFVALADPIVAGTDEKRGLRDYKGRTQVGWGSVAYSGKKQRVVWLAHTGMITYPLARFALLVHETAALANYSTKARSYGSESEAALKEFDSQWRYDPATGEGFYTFEKDQPDYESVAGAEIPLPFNMELAAGCTFIVAWKLTGNEVYRQKAAAMATLFKNHLVKDATGAYQWTYWFGPGLSRSKSREDLSHGAIDIAFAVLAEQNGIVFAQADLAPFVTLFFEQLKQLDARSSPLNTANATSAEVQDRDSIAMWIALSENSCRVYAALAPNLLTRTGRQDARVLLALAQLAQYSSKTVTNPCHLSLRDYAKPMTPKYWESLQQGVGRWQQAGQGRQRS